MTIAAEASAPPLALDDMIVARARTMTPAEALQLLVERLGALPSPRLVQLGAPGRLPALVDTFAAIRRLHDALGLVGGEDG